MKKIAFILILTVVLMTMLGGCARQPVSHQYNEEILVNGNFESWNGDVPTGWRLWSDSTGAISKGAHNTQSDFVTENELGNSYLKITNSTLGRTYISQTIDVEPGAVYLVEAFIKVDKRLDNGTYSTIPGSGARIGILEDTKSPYQGLAAVKAWGEYKTHFYFKTDLSTINLFVSVGDADNAMSGTASFDYVSVKKIDVNSDYYKDDLQDTIYTCRLKENIGWTADGGLFTAICIVLVVVLFAVAFVLSSKKVACSPLCGLISAGCVILAGIGVRVLVSSLFIGARQNVSHVLQMGASMLSGGFTTAYSVGTEVGPIAYYLYALIGLITGGNSELTMTSALIAKLPLILADAVTSFVIFWFLKKHVGNFKALVGAGLYAVLPAVFATTAVWGAVQSLTATFIVLAITSMADRKVISSVVFTILALATSVEAVFILPVVCAFVTWVCIKDKAVIPSVVITAGVGLVGIFLLALPVSAGASVAAVFVKYYQAIASLSGFNFAAVVSGVGGQILNIAFNVLYFALIATLTIMMYLKRKNRLDAMLLSVFSIIATAFFAPSVGQFFLLPAIALLITYSLIKGDGWSFLLSAAVSVLHCLNALLVAGASGYFTNYLSGFLTAIASGTLSIVLGVLYVLCVAGCGVLCYFITGKEKKN